MGLTKKKIKAAFVKWYGLTTGGSERWLHTVMTHLNKDKFEIDFYYNGPEDSNVKQMLTDNGINLIHFSVKNRRGDFGEWEKSDFWKKFRASKYDFVQTVKSGPREYPYYLIEKPVIERVVFPTGVDKSKNIFYSFFLSDWLRNIWLSLGGREERSCLVPPGTKKPASAENLRQALISPPPPQLKQPIVAGFHQRVDDNIFSPIPLRAFKEIEKENYYFIILGGSKRYREQAKELGIKNVIFLDHNSDKTYISKFLNTLDIFAHGRYDGETFGNIFAEALMHGKPCITHKSDEYNAHKDTIGPHGIWTESQEEYTEKLKQLFEDESLRKQLSEGAREFAEKNYMIEPAMKMIEEIYIKAAEDGKKHWLKYKLYAKIEWSKVLFKKTVKVLAIIIPVKSLAVKMRNYGRSV